MHGQGPAGPQEGLAKSVGATRQGQGTGTGTGSDPGWGSPSVVPNHSSRTSRALSRAHSPPACMSPGPRGGRLLSTVGPDGATDSTFSKQSYDPCPSTESRPPPPTADLDAPAESTPQGPPHFTPRITTSLCHHPCRPALSSIWTLNSPHTALTQLPYLLPTCPPFPSLHRVQDFPLFPIPCPAAPGTPGFHPLLNPNSTLARPHPGRPLGPSRGSNHLFWGLQEGTALLCSRPQLPRSPGLV